MLWVDTQHIALFGDVDLLGYSPHEYGTSTQGPERN